MENKVDLQCNRIFHLEDSVVMYGIYNSDTLKALIDTVHRLYTQSTWNEKVFAGQIEDWYHYAIDSLFFLTTARKKYVKMYEKFINQLREYSHGIRILSNGYLPISLLLPSKLNTILGKEKETLQIRIMI